MPRGGLRAIAVSSSEPLVDPGGERDEIMRHLVRASLEAAIQNLRLVEDTWRARLRAGHEQFNLTVIDASRCQAVTCTWRRLGFVFCVRGDVMS